MNCNKFLVNLIILPVIFFISGMKSCNPASNEKEKEPKSETSINPANVENPEPIPDSTVQFLITSASKDFHEHQPPTAIDFRNVRSGYILSPNEKIYLLCGEFLSQEKKAWESFTTIKTSGYEQYLGDNIYCQKATMIMTGKYDLSAELKNKLTALRK